MARQRQRVCLQDGLRLDLNRLIRQRFIVPGYATTGVHLSWSYTYTGERIASAVVSSRVQESCYSWIKIDLDGIEQTISLENQARKFGGYQWYFICPRTSLSCSVLWKPPGARTFAARQAWGRQVAYKSQFESRYDRALGAAQGIRARLGGPSWAGLDGFDPPKPKWMRWRTYDREIERSHNYEAIADERTFALVARLMRLG